MCGAQDMVHSQKRRQTTVLELGRTPPAALPGSSHMARPPSRAFRSPDAQRAPHPTADQTAHSTVWAFLATVLRLAYRFFSLRENSLPTAPFYRPLLPPSPKPLRFCPFRLYLDLPAEVQRRQPPPGRRVGPP